MKKMLSQEAIASLCLELSLLFHAGVTAGDALALLAEQGSQEDRPLLEAMAQCVDRGESLASAMRSAQVFPPYVWGLVETGERTGRTEEALAAISEYYEQRARQRQRVRSALLYPALMLVLMLIVIAVLLVKVLPIFNDVYGSLGGQLTGVAGGLLLVGRLLDKLMPVLWLVLVLAALALAAFGAVPAVHEGVLSWWRRRQGDKGISRKLNDGKVAQVLAMGMASGLALEESLELAEQLLEDAPGAKKRCEDCQRLLDTGSPQSQALRESGLLPAAQCRLLELGQRSGAGDTVMAKIAEDLSEQGETALEARLGRIEPTLVLVSSILVGLILLSVMLPLTHIMSAIG